MSTDSSTALHSDPNIHLNGLHAVDGQVQKSNVCLIIVAVGVIVSLGGIFLTLAAYQIFPVNANVISHLDTGGQVMAYGVLGLGITIIGISSTKRYLIQHQNAENTRPSSPPPPSSSTHAIALPQTEEIYSLDNVIGRVREARREGVKTALFVGRTNDQSVPIETGWVWFTLDCEMMPGNCSHHLNINFNHSGAVGKIANLFDKILVDYSVIKAFSGSPWDTLHRILYPNKSSELIVESDKGGGGIGPTLFIDGRNGTMSFSYSDYFNEEKSSFAQWKEGVGKRVTEEEYQKYFKRRVAGELEEYGLQSELAFMRFILAREKIAPLYPADKYRPQLLNAIADYLRTLFDNVELKRGPYPALEEVVDDYWVVSSPKKVLQRHVYQESPTRKV